MAFRLDTTPSSSCSTSSQQFGSAQDAPPHTRIVTSPHYARGFLETLQAAVEAYEKEFGAIEAGPPRAKGGNAKGN
jgi:hypothetical protein